jgi:hypothetical protein
MAQGTSEPLTLVSRLQESFPAYPGIRRSVRRVSLQVKGDDPSLSVHRRNVPGQGRPLVAGLRKDACRTKMVPLVQSRWDIPLDIYRSIYRSC